MTVAELIAQLQQFNPNALVVQSERAGTYSPTGLIEAGLYETRTKTSGIFWVPEPTEDGRPWNPEPGVDVHAVCLWAASWPVGPSGVTGA